MAMLRRGTKDSVELGDEVVVLSRKAAKEAAKAEKQVGKAAKADRKAVKKADKAREAEAKSDAKGPDPVTGAKVKRYIGIARVVVPIVAPLLYQAAGTARARWDEHRARQFGVAPEQLADFTGRGAALYARIHNLASSTRDLAERRGADGDRAAEVRAFAEQTGARLTDLEAAVRSAEQMPADRRRRAHQAAAAELDRIETRLLSFWGVGDGPGSVRG